MAKTRFNGHSPATANNGVADAHTASFSTHRPENHDPAAGPYTPTAAADVEKQPNLTPKALHAAPHYGGIRGNGSTFHMNLDEYTRLDKREAKYRKLAQKILDRCGIKIAGDRPFDLVVHNPLLYRRVISKGSIGFGEAFMDGWWDTRDFYALDEFFKRLLESDVEYYFPNNAKDMANIVKAKLFNPQTRSKSKKVGLQHYDLGNEFFRNMLGPRMQYSCAYWERHVGSREENTLERIETLDEAQELKLHMLGEKLKLKPGMEVLDVGCGWGTLAGYLSETYNVKVTGITISEQQRKSAAERNKNNPRVTILKQDYRDTNFGRKFDRIVSVGMFEHVGPKNYSTFFKHMRRLLNDTDRDAVFVLHTIGSKTTMESADQWYLKYIFPGGCLPSISNIGKTIEKYFLMEDLHNFGYYYALTLLAWRENFLARWNNSPESKRQNADLLFRMFYYYLSSSAGAFEARNLQLWQIVLSPHGVPGYANVYRP
ncbi:Cyclopropane-fatty-acyl-phospholipid synthase [Leptomonas seymouri]|uniref:Cyclopropane-fatty-acyl-phospholipid synthase n=1 Tax=Leptomonas seymouri TaxID=5684 RepID=A0A0N0P927_LEPSE|nr:Cyclopropane-fatty-acyl-phospholipid synthase [Leptomonas seymouri]|eukprot:KPI90619.1 Cyclopropane-fatty-acyl-phospholipid synthase [Leptomonas seymouri]